MMTLSITINANGVIRSLAPRFTSLSAIVMFWITIIETVVHFVFIVLNMKTTNIVLFIKSQKYNAKITNKCSGDNAMIYMHTYTIAQKNLGHFSLLTSLQKS